MVLELDGMQVYYERFIGTSRDTTLLLHGWGASSDTMRGIFNALKSHNKSAIMLDFPYFGKSSAPPPTADIFTYVYVAEKFLAALELPRVNILAHSFGARVAMVLAGKPDTKHLINKLMLTGAAGLKPRRGPRYYCKVWRHKLRKKLKRLPKKSAGSSDYAALPDFMKGVFVRVVNTHLASFSKKIECPTLLLWGANDKDTPLYMAKKLKRYIKNSALIVLESAGHYAFLDSAAQVHAIIQAFF